jgi:hypothetical protein
LLRYVNTILENIRKTLGWEFSQISIHFINLQILDAHSAYMFFYSFNPSYTAEINLNFYCWSFNWYICFLTFTADRQWWPNQLPSKWVK